MSHGITPQEEERRADLIYHAMLLDTQIRALMDASNAVSVGEGQVEHGWTHALDVGGPDGLTWYIGTRINQLSPGRITRYDLIKAAVGGLVHDSGRSISVRDHDKHSARITNAYLRDLCVRQFGGAEFLPDRFRARAVQLARKHRADSWLYKSDVEKSRRRKEIDGADIALLLLSDKLCGSESRVPQEKLLMLKQLARVNVGKRFRRRWNLDESWTPARISWGHPEEIAQNPIYTESFLDALSPLLEKAQLKVPAGVAIGHHFQVNGAIEDRVIEIFADDAQVKPDAKIWGTFLYRLRVDEGIATQELVTGLDWWREAFHVSAKAAKYLGLRFRIDFNGHVLEYDRTAKNWVRVDARHV